MHGERKILTEIGLAIVVVLGSGESALAQEGKLDRVGEAVRNGGGGDHHSSTQLSDSEDGEADLWVQLCQWILLSPFYVPSAILEDGGGPGSFSSYPYGETAGYWSKLDLSQPARRWSFEPRVEFASDFDRLERTTVALNIEHSSRLGFDVAWNHWHEDLRKGGNDELDLADANIVYRFACSERAAFRAGVGVNWLDDEHGQEVGINGTYAAEFMPVRPLTLGVEFDLGTLGEASLLHLRATAGVVMGPLELIASADRVEIDTVGLNSYGLGLRAWL